LNFKIDIEVDLFIGTLLNSDLIQSQWFVIRREIPSSGKGILTVICELKVKA